MRPAGPAGLGESGGAERGRDHDPSGGGGWRAGASGDGLAGDEGGHGRPAGPGPARRLRRRTQLPGLGRRELRGGPEEAEDFWWRVYVEALRRGPGPRGGGAPGGGGGWAPRGSGGGPLRACPGGGAR